MGLAWFLRGDLARDLAVGMVRDGAVGAGPGTHPPDAIPHLPELVRIQAEAPEARRAAIDALNASTRRPALPAPPLPAPQNGGSQSQCPRRAGPLNRRGASQHPSSACVPSRQPSQELLVGRSLALWDVRWDGTPRLTDFNPFPASLFCSPPGASGVGAFGPGGVVPQRGFAPAATGGTAASCRLRACRRGPGASGRGPRDSSASVEETPSLSWHHPPGVMAAF